MPAPVETFGAEVKKTNRPANQPDLQECRQVMKITGDHRGLPLRIVSHNIHIIVDSRFCGMTGEAKMTEGGSNVIVGAEPVPGLIGEHCACPVQAR